MDAFPAKGLNINVLYSCFHFFLTRPVFLGMQLYEFSEIWCLSIRGSRQQPSLSIVVTKATSSLIYMISSCFWLFTGKCEYIKINRGCGVFMKICNGCFQVFWCRFIFPCEFIVGYFWTSCAAAFSYSLLVVVDPTLPLHLQKIRSSVFIIFLLPHPPLTKQLGMQQLWSG